MVVVLGQLLSKLQTSTMQSSQHFLLLDLVLELYVNPSDLRD